MKWYPILILFRWKMEPQRAGDYGQHNQVAKTVREPRYLNSTFIPPVSGSYCLDIGHMLSWDEEGLIEMEAYSERRLGVCLVDR